jgi:hypothetical protein
MIWQTLLLFAGSFLLTALLQPKPQIEDAKAEDFDPDSFPKASEDSPLPLVLGVAVIEGINTLWYGDYKVTRQTQKVKTGVFSSKKVTIGFRYYMSFDLAVCMGPNAQIIKIHMDETLIYKDDRKQSVLVGQDSAYLDFPNLFGGDKQGGGFRANLRTYDGGWNQPVNDLVQDIVGFDIPAYRGTAHMVFEKAYLGESPSLRVIKATVSCFSRTLGQTTDPIINDTEINPVEAIAVIISDKWRGLGRNINEIDMANFQEIASVLKNEGQGVALAITSSQTGKELVSEILRQVDGSIYEDATTGKIQLGLNRDDDPVVGFFDESEIVDITNFSKTSFEDVVSEVRVSYAKLDGDSGAVAMAQDPAIANMMGRRKSVVLSYPFCYSPETANKIAARELSRMSNPLFTMTIEMRKRSYNLKPGSVIEISWAKYGIQNLRVRVQKFDLGELANNRVIFNCIQDAFADSDPLFATPTGSAWVEPATSPALINSSDIVEMPYFYNSRIEFPAAEGLTNVIVLARKPQTVSTGYSVLLGLTAKAVTSLGDISTVTDPEAANYSQSFILDETLSYLEGFETGVKDTLLVTSPISYEDEPYGHSSANIRSGEEGIYCMNGEFIAFSTVTDLTGGIYSLNTVRRGLFGTRPKDHPIGTVIYGVTTNQLGEGLLNGALSSTGTIFYKAVDEVAGQEFYIDDILHKTKIMTQAKDRPLRPRYINIAGSRIPPVQAQEPVTFNFRSSNREADTVTFEADATQVPDQPETYNLEVIINGSPSPSRAQTGITGSTFTVDFSIVTGDVEVRLYSKRTSDGLVSSNYAFLTVPVNVSFMKLSGDAQTGGDDQILLSGDMQATEYDKLKVTG